MAMQKMAHPDGELAVVRAAAKARIGMVGLAASEAGVTKEAMYWGLRGFLFTFVVCAALNGGS